MRAAQLTSSGGQAEPNSTTHGPPARTVTSGPRWPYRHGWSRGGLVFVDIETTSLASLSAVGGRNYAAHASTEVVCVVALLPSGKRVEWTPRDAQPEELLASVRDGSPVVAHNAEGFDRHLWARLGWPEPIEWIDTLPLARLLGLPGDLDSLSQVLLGQRKDIDGQRLTRALSRPDRKTGRLPAITAATVERVKQYCGRDVDLLKEVWSVRLREADASERGVLKLDTKINSRGFAFDKELARAIIDCEAAVVREVKKQSPVAATVLASEKQLRTWLNGAGVQVKDVRAGTLEALLEDPNLADDVRRALVARLASSTITSRKLQAALQRLSPDGRLRDAFTYHAAHTGRWSGNGFQPQNLPRGVDIDIDAAVTAALARDVCRLHELADQAETSVEAILGSLVRPCVIAPPGRLLAVADFASIEARALAWLAGDQQTLRRYANGEDLYRMMAASLLGKALTEISKAERNLGKALVLSAGYQVGASGFEIHASAYSVDWSVLPVTPGQAVEAWRDAHTAVAGERTGDTFNGRVIREGGLWRAFQDAAFRAVHGEQVAVSCTLWRREGDAVVCQLPSGRRLIYPDAGIELRPTPWGKLVDTFTYLRHGQRVSSYGGKLTENVTQAICRDILATSMLALDEADYTPVLHVHDEIVSEISDPDEVEQIVSIMTASPRWAPTLPLRAEGAQHQRYQK